MLSQCLFFVFFFVSFGLFSLWLYFCILCVLISFLEMWRQYLQFFKFFGFGFLGLKVLYIVDRVVQCSQDMRVCLYFYIGEFIIWKTCYEFFQCFVGVWNFLVFLFFEWFIGKGFVYFQVSSRVLGRGFLDFR